MNHNSNVENVPTNFCETDKKNNKKTEICKVKKKMQKTCLYFSTQRKLIGTQSCRIRKHWLIFMMDSHANLRLFCLSVVSSRVDSQTCKIGRVTVTIKVDRLYQSEAEEFNYDGKGIEPVTPCTVVRLTIPLRHHSDHLRVELRTEVELEFATFAFLALYYLSMWKQCRVLQLNTTHSTGQHSTAYVLY